jgi:predicted GIY-YIG superfamily endonuclease
MPYLNPPPLGTAAATFNAPELARETQLKNWSRAKKVALIRERNPEWLDLSRSA